MPLSTFSSKTYIFSECIVKNITTSLFCFVQCVQFYIYYYTIITHAIKFKKINFLNERTHTLQVYKTALRFYLWYWVWYTTKLHLFFLTRFEYKNKKK